MTIDQKPCIKRIIKSVRVSTKDKAPVSPTTDLRLREEPEEEFKESCQQPIEVLLMWFTNMTMSDIIDTVREVPKQAHNPAPRHWEVHLRVLE